MSLTDFLDWLGRPGQVVRNTITGNIAGAGRQLGQFVGDPLDMFIPGDQINLVRPEDNISGGDILERMGAPKEDSLAKTVAGIGLEMATDPLTYFGGGLVKGAAKGAASTVNGLAKAALPAGGYAAAAKLAQDTGDFAADTFNWHRMSPAQEAGVNSASSVVGQSMQAQEAELRAMFGGVPGAESEAASDVLLNIDRSTPGLLAQLGPRTEGWGTVQEQLQRIQPLIQARTAAGGVDQAKVAALVEDAIKHGGTQWQEGVANNVFVKPAIFETHKGYRSLSDIQDEIDTLAASAAKVAQENHGMPVSFPKATPKDALAYASNQGWAKSSKDLVPHAYVQRTLGQMDDLGEILPGAPSAVQARSLKSDKDFIDWLNASDINDSARDSEAAKRQWSLVTDLPTLMAQRAQQQGRLLQKAQVMQAVAPGSVLAKAGDIAAVRKTLAEKAANSRDAGERDWARQMQVVLDGMPERNLPQQMLAEVNKIFKKPVTMGLGIINPAFFMRNRVGDIFMQMGGSEKGIFGALADTGARRSFAPGNIINDMGAAFAEYGAQLVGKGGKGASWVGDAVAKDLDQVDEAFRLAGGRRDIALQKIRDPVVQDAVRGGILDGNPTKREELVKVLTGDGKTPLWKRFLDAPAEANSVLEDRMRLGAYKALRGPGGTAMPHEQAVSEVNKRMLNYRQVSKGNRLLRDMVPFAAFQAGIIPQIAKSPLTLSAASATMGGGEEGGDPMYPYMQGRANLPMGLDEQGNPQYATSLGLPFEALNFDPLSASDVFSAANPIAKTAYGMFTGEDPYFRTPYGSYDKQPHLAAALGLVGEDRSGGDLGAAINKLRGSGLTAPLEGVIGLRQWETWLDPRLSATDALLKSATGVRPVSVDPDLAERQTIEAWLKEHPREVKSYQQYYTTEPNAEVDQMLADFHAAKERLKEKRKAAELAGGTP